jgi:hypothetical protein
VGRGRGVRLLRVRWFEDLAMVGMVGFLVGLHLMKRMHSGMRRSGYSLTCDLRA